MKTTDLQAMGLTEMNETEMMAVEGGNIFSSIWKGVKSVAEYIWDYGFYYEFDL